ncbi:MAG TPA: hypothetical protein VJK52_01130 [Candidatus Nanoarchaeia archaeon]|nr:hypothetical protein [Candidatus Nanoarchaeia archaeon]
MVFDFRKIVVILIIATLTWVFAHAMTLAVQPKPQYDDFCKGRVEPAYPTYPAKPIGPDDRSAPTCTVYQYPDAEACVNQKGYVEYKYNASGCAYEGYCNTCQRDFSAAQEKWNSTLFFVYLIIAALAITAGLMLSPRKADVNRWLGTGFLLGALVCLFVATVIYFTQLNRFFRPVFIFLELVLVIYLSYKQLGGERVVEKLKKK